MLPLFGLYGYFYWKVIHPSNTTRHNNWLFNCYGCLTVRRAVLHSKQLWTPAWDNVWLRLHTRRQIEFRTGPLPHLWNVSHPTHGLKLGVCREWDFISSPKNARLCACVHTCVLSYYTFPCLFSFGLGQDARAPGSGAQSRGSAESWVKAMITLEIFYIDHFCGINVPLDWITLPKHFYIWNHFSHCYFGMVFGLWTCIWPDIIMIVTGRTLDRIIHCTKKY